MLLVLILVLVLMLLVPAALAGGGVVGGGDGAGGGVGGAVEDMPSRFRIARVEAAAAVFRDAGGAGRSLRGTRSIRKNVDLFIALALHLHPWRCC
jgi:hypothetical protein